MTHLDAEYVITGDGIRLRPFQDDDIPAIAAGCSDPLTRRFMAFLPQPYDEAVAREWVQVGSLRGRESNGVNLAIADPVTDQLFGAVGLTGRDTGERKIGEVGYWLGPWGRGHGYARAAVRAIVPWAHARGFVRLELLTAVANTASQRVALASGFQREGVRRGGGAAPDGSRHDFVVFARLAGEPVGPVARRLPDLPGGYLSDGVVSLSPTTIADADDVYRLAQLPEVINATVPPVAKSLAQIQERTQASASAWLAGERAEMIIRDAATHVVAGRIALFYQEPTTGQAMIGYDMLPEWRGRGYASKAARLIAGWAFKEVGIARLIAGTAPENRASQRVLENAGFKREGYQRSRLPGPNGTRIDDILWALLPDDLESGIA